VHDPTAPMVALPLVRGSTYAYDQFTKAIRMGLMVGKHKPLGRGGKVERESNKNKGGVKY